MINFNHPSQSSRGEDEKITSELLEKVLIGGNHLALHIGAEHPLYTDSCDTALAWYGPGIKYDVWCCWKNIMELSRVHQRLMAQPPSGNVLPELPGNWRISRFNQLKNNNGYSVEIATAGLPTSKAIGTTPRAAVLAAIAAIGNNIVT